MTGEFKSIHSGEGLGDLGLVDPETEARSKRRRRRLFVGAAVVLGLLAILAIVGAILGPPPRSPSGALSRWARTYEQPEDHVISSDQSSINADLGQWLKGSADVATFNHDCSKAKVDLVRMIGDPPAPVKSVDNSWLDFRSTVYQLDVYDCLLPGTAPNSNARSLRQLEVHDTLTEVTASAARFNSIMRGQGFSFRG
jgi:hypothetical protein